MPCCSAVMELCLFQLKGVVVGILSQGKTGFANFSASFATPPPLVLPVLRKILNYQNPRGKGDPCLRLLHASRVLEILKASTRATLVTKHSINIQLSKMEVFGLMYTLQATCLRKFQTLQVRCAVFSMTTGAAAWKNIHLLETDEMSGASASYPFWTCSIHPSIPQAASVKTSACSEAGGLSERAQRHCLKLRLTCTNQHRPLTQSLCHKPCLHPLAHSQNTRGEKHGSWRIQQGSKIRKAPTTVLCSPQTQASTHS
ncbi:hypothetical protein DUNSADRAFT_3848 [Dunaliella salina]|uniref:Encoded protein n=1 Tax=Dunaliella salina TaxID=3046 RepID=A0ABQ7GT42_DUNSA|nr:hypothetical protein DUNSADRAFT_3848 [Dunaliella salina]|eukprot:KAF5837776.1 hypothetical protein DUNSADRAFT_3848 [Dunaliella salina]